MSEHEYTSLGELISSGRMREKFTLKQLADQTGTSKGHLSDIENEHITDIGLSLAFRISIILDINLYDMAMAQLKGQLE